MMNPFTHTSKGGRVDKWHQGCADIIIRASVAFEGLRVPEDLNSRNDFAIGAHDGMNSA